MSSKLLAYLVGYTVAVYAATVAVQIYQPATGGYFNLGETVIYAAALTTTPLIAGIAGGVGAALADLTTGYAIFAPGTLVIKFVEGFAAAKLARRLARASSLPAAIFTGAILGILVALVGATYLSGAQTYLGTAWFGIEVNVPAYLWAIVGVVVAIAVAYFVGRRGVYAGETAAVLVAGMLMVLGYFLYEYFISNPLTGRPPIHALAEIPVNIGQAVVGAAIGVPVAGWLRRAGFALEQG